MQPTIKAGLRSTFHRDGTVSLFNVLTQQWVRVPADAFTPALLATLMPWERAKIERHARKAAR